MAILLKIVRFYIHARKGGTQYKIESTKYCANVVLQIFRNFKQMDKSECMTEHIQFISISSNFFLFMKIECQPIEISIGC